MADLGADRFDELLRLQELRWSSHTTVHDSERRALDAGLKETERRLAEHNQYRQQLREQSAEFATWEQLEASKAAAATHWQDLSEQVRLIGVTLARHEERSKQNADQITSLQASLTWVLRLIVGAVIAALLGIVLVSSGALHAVGG